MLTIKNLNKLNYKQLGKKNFYVESISEQFSIDNINYTASEHQYKITITNRQYAIIITLERTASHTIHNDTYWHYKLHSSTGHVLYIEQSDIRNMDIFIDKLRFVALGN
jgi:hypothetical protein